MMRRLPSCSRHKTVFISGPGDLTDAKQAVAEAVEEVSRLFAPHGLQVTSWRYETDGKPEVGPGPQPLINEQVPADYDIYVGLMWSRLGTPTLRAPSGTVEEFLQAQQRFVATGKPDIMFYFCTNPARPNTESEKEQLKKAGDFRKMYPGLFATFQTVEELKALVKHHMIDLLLREAERRISRKRGWALWLAEQLDDAAKSFVYLDRSPGFVVRSLGKLETLLDLFSLLNEAEYETLLATQYIRSLRLAGANLSVVRKKITVEFPTTFDWDSAVLAADLADSDNDTISGEHQINGVRCGFLAALVRLGDVLDLDHAAITGEEGSLEPPLTNDPIQNWLAYLTRRVRVSRGGVVGFHLGVPTKQKSLAQSLCRNVGLRFEACWHQLRAMLSVHGVAITRVPTEWALTDELVAVPDAVLAALKAATKQAVKAIRDLQHYGEESPSPNVLSSMLPLPRTAVIQPVRFTFHPDLRHQLQFWREDGTGVREFTAERPGEILLDPAILLPPGARYRWRLQRDNGDFFSEVAFGVIWQLADGDKIRLAVGETLPNLRPALLSRLGLHNDLLHELWPKLLSEQASPGELECVYDALLTSYDWLQANAPESSQVDLIRNLGNWVYKQILNEKGNYL